MMAETGLTKMTHRARAVRYANGAFWCALVAELCWRFAHRPFSAPIALVFASGVLGAVAMLIMAAGAYVLHLLGKRRQGNG